MNRNDALLAYVLRLGDNTLITSQRLIERVAGEPELEEELANANFALDYLGQARLYYSYAGELEGKGRTEDDFAFHREEQKFQNFLLAEQPNGDFGDKIVRQFLFDSYYLLQLQALAKCTDSRLAEIAVRAEKELRYHLRHVKQWLLRLGDGTEESHQRSQAALDSLWRFTGEFFIGDEVDAIVRDEISGPDLDALRSEWQTNVTTALATATLTAPEHVYTPTAGRAGNHSEHLGYLIAEMQHLQRVHPGATW